MRGRQGLPPIRCHLPADVAREMATFGLCPPAWRLIIYLRLPTRPVEREIPPAPQLMSEPSLAPRPPWPMSYLPSSMHWRDERGAIISRATA